MFPTQKQFQISVRRSNQSLDAGTVELPIPNFSDTIATAEKGKSYGNHALTDYLN